MTLQAISPESSELKTMPVERRKFRLDKRIDCRDHGRVVLCLGFVALVLFDHMVLNYVFIVVSKYFE